MRTRSFFERAHCVRRPDGTLGWTLSRAVPLLDEHGEVEEWVGAASDVTARRQAEQTRRHGEEQRLRALIEETADVVWETDADGTVHTDSPSWRAFTGQTHEQELGHGWLDAVHPEDREQVTRDWLTSQEAGRRVRARCRIWHAASGTWHPIVVRAVPLRDEDGTARGRICTGIDLTVDEDATAAGRMCGRTGSRP